MPEPTDTAAPAATPERPDTASKIQSQFDKVFADVNESDLIRPDVTEKKPATTEVEQETEEVVTDDAETSTDADEPATEPATDDAGKTDTKPEAAATGAPTLPAAYVRSLKAYDWTDEEIAEAAKQPGFITTAAKIHQNRNKEVSQWAEAGRKARETVPSKEAAADKPDANDSTLKPIDATALKKQYGEEALIDAIVGPVNRTIEQINRMMPIAAQAQQAAQMQQMDALGRQVDGFFSSKELVAYKDTYGTASNTLTEPQAGERQKVLELADALIGGARMQGRQLQLTDALQMAFDSVSSGTQKQAARKEITTALQQRNKGITLKPSARAAKPANNAPAKDRSELESRVKGSLAKMFR